MTGRSIEALPAVQQIALAHARRGREALLTLFALDRQCGNILRQAREPMLAQLRLTWWRDTILRGGAEQAGSDPLLSAIPAWKEQSSALAEVVSAWEHLVGDAPLDDYAIHAFVSGRAAGFGGFARLLGQGKRDDEAELAGRRWALADLVTHLGNPAERERALAIGSTLPDRRVSLPASLRPLAVLDGLARRSLSKGGAPLLDGRLSALAALRIGLIGR